MLLRHRTSAHCNDIQFSPSDDQILLAAYESREVVMWNFESQSVVLSFQHRGIIKQYFQARFRPGTDKIIVIGKGRTIECWLVAGNAASHSRDITTDVGDVMPVSVSEDVNKIALHGEIGGGWVVIVAALEPAAVT